MRWVFVVVLIALASGCGIDEAGRASEAVIFGADDRVEVFEVSDPALRELVIRAVPAMVHRRSVRVDAETGALTLAGSPLGERHELCDGEAFPEEPSSASCSATLIDDDLVLTAGHCVDAIACDDQRYVFGWYYESPGVLHALDDASVYACAEVVAWELTSRTDFAIVRLDRPAPGPPAEVRREPVTVGETMSLAGYPLGIPMKVVEEGPVTGFPFAGYFWARLDAHPGNSGSGVFDSSYRVAGELTAGPIGAFVDAGTCTRLRVIGEDSEVAEYIQSIVPALDALCASDPSARFCCGDGVCSPGEECEVDCMVDAGAPDAGADAGAFDAGPPDAGAPVDAGAQPADAGALPAGGGCGCSIAGAGGGRWLMPFVAALRVWPRRRRARGGSSRPLDRSTLTPQRPRG